MNKRLPKKLKCQYVLYRENYITNCKPYWKTKQNVFRKLMHLVIIQPKSGGKMDSFLFEITVY